MPWMANYNPSRDDSLPLHSTVLRTTTGYSVPVLRRCNPSINSRSRTVNASVIPPSLTDPGYVLTNHHIPILIKLNLYGMLVRIYFALHAALWDLGSLNPFKLILNYSIRSTYMHACLVCALVVLYSGYKVQTTYVLRPCCICIRVQCIV